MAVVVTEKDDGGTVRANVGDTVEVHLAENGGGGYRWELEGLDSRLFAVVGTTTKYPSGVMGSGGEFQVTLKVLAAGSASLRLKCWRSWEGDSGVLQRFAVKVDAL